MKYLLGRGSLRFSMRFNLYDLGYRFNRYKNHLGVFFSVYLCLNKISLPRGRGTYVFCIEKNLFILLIGFYACLKGRAQGEMGNKSRVGDRKEICVLRVFCHHSEMEGYNSRWLHLDKASWGSDVSDRDYGKYRFINQVSLPQPSNRLCFISWSRLIKKVW